MRRFASMMIVAAALGLASAGTSAQAVAQSPAEPTIAAFMGKAQELVKLGEAGATSPQAGELIGLMKDASAKARATIAAEPAGVTCLPAPGEGNLTLADVMNNFRAMPVPQRERPFSTGMAEVLRAKFPCRQ